MTLAHGTCDLDRAMTSSPKDRRKSRPQKEKEKVVEDVSRVTFVRHPSAPLGVPAQVRALHQQQQQDGSPSSCSLPARDASADARAVARRLPPSCGPVSDLELHSVHRVGLEMLEARSALDENEGAEEDPERLEGFARSRMEASPDQAERVEREAARGVDFGHDEVLFRDLQALDVSESEFREFRGRKKQASSSQKKRIPAPSMEDFHSPYPGEDMAVEAGEHDQEEVFRQLDEARKRRRNRRKERPQSDTSSDYISTLDRLGLR